MPLAPSRYLRLLALLGLFVSTLAPAALAQPPGRPPQPPPRPPLAPLPEPTHVPPTTPPPEAKREASGLVSQVLRQGTGKERPDANDMVEVHFAGWGPAGNKFASSYPSGKAASFSLSLVFPGWREGMMLMTAGEKRRLWIPANLGPQHATSGPKEAIFEIELESIIKVPNPPEHLQRPDPTATRTPSGLFTKKIQSGTGKIKPGPASRVLLNYALWTADGKTFDSTFSRKRPTAFMLDRVLPAFAEGVQLMVEGEKRLFWISEGLGGSQWPGSPKGMLVFEVEMLTLMPDDSIQPTPADQVPIPGQKPQVPPGGGGV
jgi:FKBP-type peptidyl-prolyl cis-trans isomerase